MDTRKARVIAVMVHPIPTMVFVRVECPFGRHKHLIADHYAPDGQYSVRASCGRPYLPVADGDFNRIMPFTIK